MNERCGRRNPLRRVVPALTAGWMVMAWGYGTGVHANDPAVDPCTEAASTNKTPTERYRESARVRACLESYLDAGSGGAAVPKAFGTEQNLRRKAADAAQKEEDDKAKSQFMGVGFGVGFGFSYHADELVSEAEVDSNNILRATESTRSEARVILETHYYPECEKSKVCSAGEFGIGPFFGIAVSDDDLISSFAAGLMFGWKDKTPGDKGGFSVGVGALLDNDVKTLGAGFELDEPLPLGETEPRYNTTSKWGAVLFFTRTF